jgi:hypothetical protein
MRIRIRTSCRDKNYFNGVETVANCFVIWLSQKQPTPRPTAGGAVHWTVHRVKYFSNFRNGKLIRTGFTPSVWSFQEKNKKTCYQITLCYQMTYYKIIWYYLITSCYLITWCYQILLLDNIMLSDNIILSSLIIMLSYNIMLSDNIMVRADKIMLSDNIVLSDNML